MMKIIKNYIVYTDNTLDENKKLRIYYALYESVNNEIKLIEVKTNKEKQIGIELIKAILEKLNS